MNFKIITKAIKAGEKGSLCVCSYEEIPIWIKYLALRSCEGFIMVS